MALKNLSPANVTTNPGQSIAVNSTTNVTTLKTRKPHNRNWHKFHWTPRNESGLHRILYYFKFTLISLFAALLNHGDKMKRNTVNRQPRSSPIQLFFINLQPKELAPPQFVNFAQPPSMFASSRSRRQSSDLDVLSRPMDPPAPYFNDWLTINRSPNLNDNNQIRESINYPAMNGGDAFALQAIIGMMERANR